MLSIEQATKRILIKSPFYGCILLSVNRRFATTYDKNCNTAYATRNGCAYEIIINKSFWDSLENDDCRCNLLLHEILHLCLKHLNFNLWTRCSNKKLLNYAMDCEVSNYCGYITKDGIAYTTLKFPPRKGTNWYYNQLLEQFGNQELPSSCQLIDDHSHFQGDENPAELEIADSMLNSIIKRTTEEIQKSRGTIPGELEELISTLFKKREPIFNWRKYFRRLLGSSYSDKIRKTRKKESKRFPDASGLKHFRKVNLFVVIDTSLSINQKECNEFFNEISMIYKAGARITICECDTTVTRMYEYTGVWDGKITGRGGTFLSPAIEEFNKRRKDYQSIIFFTDGFIEEYPIRIQGNAIWVITSTGNTHRKYQGKTILIPIQ